MKKRIVTFALALLFMVSLMPSTTYAATICPVCEKATLKTRSACTGLIMNMSFADCTLQPSVSDCYITYIDAWVGTEEYCTNSTCYYANMINYETGVHRHEMYHSYSGHPSQVYH